MSPEEFQELFFGMMSSLSGAEKARGYSCEGQGAFGSSSRKAVDYLFVGGDDLTRTPLYELVGDGVQNPLIMEGGEDVWGVYGTFHGFSIESKPVGKHNRSGEKEAVRLYLKTPAGRKAVIQMGLGTMAADALLRSLQLLANEGRLYEGCEIDLAFQRGEEGGKVSKSVFLNMCIREDGQVSSVNTLDTPYAFVKSNPSHSLDERGRARALEQKTRAANIRSILDK